MVVLLVVVASGVWGQDAERIVTGAERMEQYVMLARMHNTAVVANQASMVGARHLVDTLMALGANLRVIFCPEHGFRGEAAAGAYVKDGVDEKTGIPIVSLYGNNKKPSQEVLRSYGIDYIIFDLQDVGCRFYTYISTLHYVKGMKIDGHGTVAEKPIPVTVLDRPNPNGHYVDGPVLEMKYKSFVGMHPVPVVYGMTIGEYARMINGEGWLADSMACPLHVVALQHYTHDSGYRLPVNPSPNLRTPQAIALYPSLCLFEGTNISVGRGTPYPFEVIGNTYKMDLRRVEVKPCFDLTYLLEMYRHTPKGKFFQKSNFFEKLAGNGKLRQQIENGVSEAKIRASWESELTQFKAIRDKYLLYP